MFRFKILVRTPLKVLSKFILTTNLGVVKRIEQIFFKNARGI